MELGYDSEATSIQMREPEVNDVVVDDQVGRLQPGSLELRKAATAGATPAQAQSHSWAAGAMEQFSRTRRL